MDQFTKEELTTLDDALTVATTVLDNARAERPMAMLSLLGFDDAHFGKCRKRLTDLEQKVHLMIRKLG